MRTMWRIPYGIALIAVIGQPVLTTVLFISTGGSSLYDYTVSCTVATLFLVTPPIMLGALVSPPQPMRWAPAWRAFCLAFLTLNFTHVALLEEVHETIGFGHIKLTTFETALDLALRFSPTLFGLLSACWSAKVYAHGGEMATRRGFSLAVLLALIGFVCMWLVLAGRMPIRYRHGGNNETSAVAALKQLVSTESTWRQTDSDGNGIQDYWTLDVAGFYGMQDNSGSILKFIDVNFAKADARPRASYAGRPNTPQAKSGYRFQAMMWDEDGGAYNVNYVPTQKNATVLQGRPACNSWKYGFTAIPDTYDVTGLRTFIVNEEGVVYGVDSGSNAPVLRWPGTDPTACTVNGRFWSVVQ